MTNFEATMIVEGCWDMTSYEPNEENFIDACQHLIDTGLAWTLQGAFGRCCQHMINEGLCTQKGTTRHRKCLT